MSRELPPGLTPGLDIGGGESASLGESMDNPSGHTDMPPQPAVATTKRKSPRLEELATSAEMVRPTRIHGALSQTRHSVVCSVCLTHGYQRGDAVLTHTPYTLC